MTTKRHRKSYLFFTIFMLFTMIIAGCSSKSNTDAKKDPAKNQSAKADKPQSGGTITIGSLDEPDTLDVHKTAMSIASQITGKIGGNLLAINPDTDELEPYLAESYSVSEDGKTITFKIRQGVKFSDGAPLTANDFKYTFDRILDPKTGATVVASLVGGIKSTSAPDDQTFVIELATPSAPFLRNLASEGYLQPLEKAAVEKAGADYGRNPVGVGPYKFKEWVTGQSITLVRNDDFNWPQSYYKNKGKAYPDQIVYKFIPDAQTMLAALDSGSIDIAMGVAPKDVQRYQNNPKFNVLDVDRQGLGLFLEMNQDNQNLKDLNVRKAINMAINKDAIIKAVVNGAGTPAFGPIPATIFGFDPNVENYGIHFNKDDAVSLLESSGYSKDSDGIMAKDGKELKFNLTTMPNQNQSAQMVQAMLKEIGIGVSIQSMETGTLIEKVSKGDYDLSFLAYSYSDPDILSLLFHSSQIGGLNHVRVKNPALDALLDKGRTTLNADERKQVYADIQKIIVENAYWAPIYAEKVYYVVNSRVHDVKLNATAPILHDAWVKQ